MGKEEQTPTMMLGTEEKAGIFLGGDTYTKDEINKKLSQKEDKSNKVDSLSGSWKDNSNNTEKYPSMAVVSNGFLGMQEELTPLKEQVKDLSEDKQDKLIIDNEVAYNSNNPVSSKAVYNHMYPMWAKTETVEYRLNELDPVVKQATTARAFDNYEKLIDFYDALEYPAFLNEISGGAAIEGYYTPVGSSMYIKTLNVPDLWVKDRITSGSPEMPSEPFCNDIKADAQAVGKTLDEYIVDQLKLNGEFSIKWLKFAQLETQKADLTNIPTKDEVVLTPTIANVGQTIIVKEVDESGKPISWEVADLPEGGTYTELYTVSKNIIDPSKIIRNGNGWIDVETGEIIDGSNYVYGSYKLTVGKTYTFSKTAAIAYLHYYNEDGSYTGDYITISALTNERTFIAEYPIVKLITGRDAMEVSTQLELGEIATEYEPYYLSLKENVIVPIIGTGELETENKTLIGAINEINDNSEKIPEIKDDLNKNTQDILNIGKVLPRLNEEITNWTEGLIDAQGNIVTSTWLHSNKILLLAGKTYNVNDIYVKYIAYYDLEGNFLGRGTDCESVTSSIISQYIGTITNGNTDIYAVLQTIPSKLEAAYVSKLINKKANSNICENLLVNKNLLNKKVLILGDSISTGDTSAKIYPGEKYGDYNKWVEALIEGNYFDESNVRNDSIHATGFVARFDGEDDLITRLRNIKDTDYDLVIVFAGINDSLRADTIEVGFGMDEQGNKETDITKYFVPAVDTFFAELTEKFVEARICVILPLRTRHKYAGHGINEPVVLADGSTSRLETDYADYIKTVAEEYCLPVLDATRHSGFSPKQGTGFYYRWVNGSVNNGLNEAGQRWSDGVHPTEEYSRKYLAPYIRSFIDKLI